MKDWFNTWRIDAILIIAALFVITADIVVVAKNNSVRWWDVITWPCWPHFPQSHNIQCYHAWPPWSWDHHTHHAGWQDALLPAYVPQHHVKLAGINSAKWSMCWLDLKLLTFTSNRYHVTCFTLRANNHKIQITYSTLKQASKKRKKINNSGKIQCLARNPICMFVHSLVFFSLFILFVRSFTKSY